MMTVGPKAGQTIADFSRQFQYEFVTLLRTRHQTNRVRANAVYNEYIQDKHHVHMNATRWVTLSGFIMTIGKAGIVKVDEDEKGLWVTWVDSSPKTLAKQVSMRLSQGRRADYLLGSVAEEGSSTNGRRREGEEASRGPD
jgi:DNA/RNA-binding protein KIN17